MSAWPDISNDRFFETELDAQHDARQEEHRQRYEDDTAMLDREARSDQHDEARYDAHEDERGDER